MRTVLILILLSAAAPELAAAPRARLATRAWTPPRCAWTGLSAVATSLDGGATILPKRDISEALYTYGLAALEAPNTLLAVSDGMPYRSRDAGCSWELLPYLEGATAFTLLEPTRGETAWAWTLNDRGLWRIDGARVTPVQIAEAPLAGLGADPADPNRLRVASMNGAIHESTDGGATWTWLSSLKLDTPLLYRIVFDRANLDHAVAGAATTGVHVTFDGGKRWTRATGLSRSGRGSVNAMSLAISPVDPNVVWAMAIDLEESDAQHPSMGRHIYLSEDGGLTFRPVVDRSPLVTIINGPVMAAHPTDRLRLFWVFGTYFQGYGTDVFDYDATTQQLRTHHHPFHDINAIAFSPADPDIIYFGIEEEQVR